MRNRMIRRPNVVTSGRWIGRRRIKDCFLDPVPLRLDIRDQVVEALIAQQPGGSQLVGENGDWVTGACLVPVFLGPVMLDIPVVVAPEAWNATLNQYRSATFARLLGGLQHGVADHSRVDTVNRDSWDTVAVRPLCNALYLEGEGSRG